MKQKIKYLMMVAIVAMTSILAFTSCSNDDSPATAAVANNNAINFNVESQNIKGTRADITNNNLTSFDVIALSRAVSTTSTNNTNYFFGSVNSGINYTNSGTSWTCGKEYYWPTDSILSFIAYSNNLVKRHCSFKDMLSVAPTIRFDYSDSWDPYADFVIAYAPNLYKANTADGTVNLQFKHPLSKVSVLIDRTQIKKEWKVMLLECTLPTVQYGDYNIATGTWNNLATSIRYIQDGNDAVCFDGDANNEDNYITNGTGNVEVWDSGNSRYVIPQKLDYIRLKVYIYDTSTNKYIAGGYILVDFNNFELKSGNSYTISLKFNGSGTNVTDEGGNKLNLKIGYNVNVDNYFNGDSKSLNI